MKNWLYIRRVESAVGGLIRANLAVGAETDSSPWLTVSMHILKSRILHLCFWFCFKGSTLATPTDETNKPRQLKDEKSLSPDNLVPKEQFCNAIRRKRAYKAAFVTLSAVTLFTFYPLPAFDFLFLFVYCNFLMFLITFWFAVPILLCLFVYLFTSCHVMICHVMLCHVSYIMLCHVMSCYVVLRYDTIRYDTIRYDIYT